MDPSPLSVVTISPAADLIESVILEQTAAKGGSYGRDCYSAERPGPSASGSATGRRTLRGRARGGWE